MAEWSQHTFPKRAAIPKPGAAGSDVAAVARQLDLTITRIAAADSPYTLLANTSILLCDTSAGAITVNLPAMAAGQDGRAVWCKNTDTGANGNDVTLDASGAETIDNALTQTIAALASLTLLGDNTADNEWWII